MPEWVKACNLVDLPRDSMRLVEIRGKRILLVNTDGVLRALDGVCTHEDADLSLGFLSKKGVTCPLHLSVFDTESGVPQNPPASKALATYRTKTEQENVMVEVS